MMPALLPWMLTFVKPYRRRVVVLSVLLGLEIALGALQPWPLKLVVDNVLQNHPFPEPVAGWLSGFGTDHITLLVVVVLAGVVLQLSNQLITMFATQVQVDMGQRLVYDLRGKLFEHLQALGLHHHVTTNTGDSVYRLEVDAYAIENLVISGLFPLATSMTALVVMFSILASMELTIALLAMSVVPLLFLCLRYYMTTLVARVERVKELESTVVERLYQTFAAMKLVKSFARERYETRRFRTNGDDVMRARINITWQESVFSVVVSSITILGTAVVLSVGGVFVLRGRMTVGDLLVVIAYLHAVYTPLSSIAHTAGQLQGAVAGARRLRTVFDTPTEHVDAADAIEADRVKGEMVFEHVGFTYPSGAEVLRDISFSARPGEMVALVGLTGAGKTTLVSLIPRLYEATEGRVLIDGVDVRRYSIRSLREKIGIVLQEPILFSGTIRENLRYGRLEASDEEIEQAADAAHAHGFVSRLPKSYDADVAEAGASLSGGERQRLSIARALVKDAPIMILDEPTSSLDSISEEIVFRAISRLRAGRTTVVIAHRLSTVRNADRIIVLDAGRIAAQGRHEELLERCDLYRRMCARLSVGRSLEEPETVDELIEAAR